MSSPTARVAWIPPEQGGRSSPPTGPRYSAPARFDAARDAWPHEAWSVVLDLISRPPGSTDWLAEVRFLFEEAPQELITAGARFELYEGKKRVAVGTVLPSVPEHAHCSEARLPQNEAGVGR